MDESKDHESVVTVKNVVSSSGSAATETVVEKVEECVGGVSEEDGGDVMVEVLGSDVFVDGDVGDEMGGGGGSGEDLASRASDGVVGGSGGIEVDNGTRCNEARDVNERIVDVAGDGNQLCEGSGSHSVKGENDGVGNGVQSSLLGSVSVAEEDEGFSAEEIEEEDKAVISSTLVSESRSEETDILKEGDERGVLPDSTSAGNQGNMQTHISAAENCDADNESVLVSEPDMQDKKIDESFEGAKDEKSNGEPSVCHENGALDEMEDVGGDMEIDVVNGSKNLQVDMKVKDGTSEKNIDLASLSGGSMEETLVPGVDVGESTKMSKPVGITILDEQVEEGEDKVQNMDEKSNMGSSILEAEVPHVSVASSPVADLDAGSRQAGEGGSEDHGSHDPRSVPDDSAANGVVQELGYHSDTSLVHGLYNSSADGVAQVDSHVEDIKELQAPCTGQVVSMDNASPNHDEPAKSLDPVAFYADDGDDPDTKDVQEVPDEEVVFMEFSPSEDKCMKLSNPVMSAADDIAQVASNVEDVQEDSVKFSDHVTSAADGVAQVDSDGVDIVEMQETAADLPFADTEAPDVPIACSSVACFDSGPTSDGNRESGDHVAYERSTLPIPSLVKGEDQELEQMTTDDVAEVDSKMEDVQDVQEQAAKVEQVDSPEDQEVDEEPVSDSAKHQSKEEKISKRASSRPGCLLKDQHISYQLPPENEGEFSVFDLVWGKVKSHPWWPGQIFHPSDSSEKAMKYYRKDCYLVAYFGDRTFAWNEASVLKPFRKHFSQAERQNKTEAFQNAVSCALAEVSRRMELGLACSCIPEEAFEKIRYQDVENTGIREESSKREGVDRCTGADFLKPNKLVEYVKSLALYPTSGVDRLELVIAKSQILAFYRRKGVDELAEFQYFEGLVDFDADIHCGDGGSGQNEREDSVTKVGAKKGPRRKHNLKDIVYQRRKEKSMTELMGETMYYLDGEFDSHEEDDNLTSPTPGTKRKASGSLTDDFTSQQGTKTISLAKVSHTVSSTPQQSFKVGECIRRVASQLTGSPLIIKSDSDGGNNKQFGDDADEVLEAADDSQTDISASPSQQSSLDEMLLQLHLSARDPMKGYSFQGDILSFFAEFRNLAVSTQRQRMRKSSAKKRKASAPVAGPPESFEFDDRNDCYWTDMVVQNTADAKPSRRGRKRKDSQVENEKPPIPRKNSRKQYFHGGHLSAAGIPTGDEKQMGQLPTELMMNFTDVGFIPSEINLNKMFRRFGPLKESETEVDIQSNRARVVYKKRSDAEVAYSSAAMFNIFGSTLVNYQLNYTPSASFRTPPLLLAEGPEDAT